jgi:hypothetical protein
VSVLSNSSFINHRTIAHPEAFIHLHSIGSLQGWIQTTIRYRISPVRLLAETIKQLSKYIRLLRS